MKHVKRFSPRPQLRRDLSCDDGSLREDFFRTGPPVSGGRGERDMPRHRSRCRLGTIPAAQTIANSAVSLALETSSGFRPTKTIQEPVLRKSAIG